MNHLSTMFSSLLRMYRGKYLPDVKSARPAAFDNLRSKQGRNKGETRTIYESVDSTTGEYKDKRQEYKFKKEDAARAAASS